MVTRTQHVLLALASALLLLGMGAGSAAALRSIEVEPAAIRAIGPVTLATGIGSIICRTTLEGSINRRTPKTREATAGQIAQVQWNECRSSPGTGEIVAVLGLNWTLKYEEFVGSLPNITGIRLHVVRPGVLIRITVIGTVTTCLYEGTLGIEVTVMERTLTKVLETGNGSVRLFRALMGLCPQEGELIMRLEFMTSNLVTLV